MPTSRLLVHLSCSKSPWDSVEYVTCAKVQDVQILSCIYAHHTKCHSCCCKYLPNVAMSQSATTTALCRFLAASWLCGLPASLAAACFCFFLHFTCTPPVLAYRSDRHCMQYVHHCKQQTAFVLAGLPVGIDIESVAFYAQTAYGLCITTKTLCKHMSSATVP